jgi:hypothetical protein
MTLFEKLVNQEDGGPLPNSIPWEAGLGMVYYIGDGELQTRGYLLIEVYEQMVHSWSYLLRQEMLFSFAHLCNKDYFLRLVL